MLKLYNTLGRKEQEFKPLKKGKAGIYCCGPTVYWYAHIGNLRTYLFEDILKRVLLYNNYEVKLVMNITDVGHLTSDEDTGEDKMEKGAKRENKSVWQIADFYIGAFKKDLADLNITSPDVWVKATDTIESQIALIKKLEEKGFVYKIEDGIYFDTSKLKDYGVLWGNKKQVQLKEGARVEMVRGKKNPTDFALWKFSPKDSKRQMEWGSPWGVGFPGWHTECVVMGADNLGAPFDIHCGGIDHIQVHHTNEMAQAAAAWGKKLANYWLHGEFLNIQGGKISKSLGNIITIDELKKQGFNPLSLRYLYLTAHYRSKLDFSQESLKAAQNALNNLYDKVLAIKSAGLGEEAILKKGNVKKYREQFLEFINNDLDMPKALALLQQLLGDGKLKDAEKYTLAIDFDKVLGLRLDEIKEVEVPEEIKQLAKERETARKAKNWQRADELRNEIESKGWLVEDTDKGPEIKPKQKSVVE